MDIKVIASGSSGNCYLITGESGNKLLLECGLPFNRVLKGINFDLKNIHGCLVTHEHKDHSKAIYDLLKHGVQVYCSEGTAKACDVYGHHNLTICQHQKQIDVAEGLWSLLPLNAEHDAAEPLMFLLIDNRTGEKLLFATDTYYIRYRFPVGLTHIMIECNYDMDILNENIDGNVIARQRKSRLLRSHMNLNTCREFFKANEKWFEKLQKIVLIHLSDSNSDVSKFISEIEKITGVPVDIV